MQPANIVKGPKVMLELDTSSIQRISKVLLFCGASAVLGCDDGAGKPESTRGCDVLRYLDTDSDGFGDPSSADRRCDEEGWVTQGGDCDDSNPAIHPDAVEVCDPDDVDEDCDGAINDENAQDAEYWYTDGDGDGYGAGAPSSRGCAPRAGEVGTHSDCDDADGAVNPGALERCDGIDNDCSGGVDDGPITEGVDAGAAAFYRDADGDGWGATEAIHYYCAASDGFVETDGDCDDAEATTHPEALESCDGIDQDCDGFLDNRCGTTHMTDAADWTLPYPASDSGSDADTILLVASDLTGDGLDDLLVGYNGTYMQLMEGPISESDGALWTVDYPTDAFAPGLGITIDADFNDDGHPDMAVPVLSYGEEIPPSIMVFYGPFTGPPEWSAPDHMLELGSAFSLAGGSGLAAADFTGDGEVDLAFDTRGAGTDIHVWTNVAGSSTAELGSSATINWSGTVFDSGSFDLGVGPTRADVNGDGNADLVHVGPDTDALSIQLGPLTSDTVLEPDYILQDTSPTSPRNFNHDLCIADFDGDGREEVGVGARRTSDARDDVELWVFAPAESSDTPVFKITEGEDAQLAVYTCTDVDGDGQADILMQRPKEENEVAYEVGAVHLFFGGITGTRSEDSADRVFMSNPVNNFFGTVVTTGDHDDDGYNDLIIGGRFSDISAFSSEAWLSEWWDLD